MHHDPAAGMVIRDAALWSLRALLFCLRFAACAHAFPLQAHPNDAVGPFLLDIGANLGWFSFQAAAAGFSVLAVEPMPHNQGAFRRTLCENPELASRITLIPKVRATGHERQRMWAGRDAAAWQCRRGWCFLQCPPQVGPKRRAVLLQFITSCRVSATSRANAGCM